MTDLTRALQETAVPFSFVAPEKRRHVDGAERYANGQYLLLSSCGA